MEKKTTSRREQADAALGQSNVRRCLLDSREAQYKGQRRQRQQESERDITIDMLDYNVKKFAQDEDEFLGLLFGCARY